MRRGSPAGGRWAQGHGCWGAAELGGTAEERRSQGREHRVWSGELVRPPPAVSIFAEARLMDSSGAAAHRLGGSRSACRGQRSHVEADLCPGKAGRTAVFASAGDGRGSLQGICTTSRLS